MPVPDPIRRIGESAVFLETYLFPIVFVYLAFKKFFVCYSEWPQMARAGQAIISGRANVEAVIVAADFLSGVIFIFFNLAVFWALVMRKNLLLQRPRGALEIYLPLLVTFFWMIYNAISFLPSRFDKTLLSGQALIWSALAGAIIGVVGWIISIIATYHLRNSYGIFIQVRKVVTHGLYKYVRHPIYFGYVLICLALILTRPSVMYLVMSGIYIWLLIVRARVEERKLADFSPAYKEYTRQVPFLFPVRLGRKK